ncbi:metallophosphoesterase, partial [Nanoarchaeota archaeon]
FCNTSLFELGKQIVHDEVLGICGVCGKGIIFISSLIFPDIPINNEIKKAPEEAYAVFIGDIHFGSKHFLQEDFDAFLKWIKGEAGNEEQKKIIEKVKYLFILGDAVEGVGIYPDQENDLEITDIKEQYKLLSEFLSQLPSHIKVIICPGNHDAMRISEPQPAMNNEFIEALVNLNNVIIVSNPSVVKIMHSNDFDGLTVLLYHGFSFPYYADKVEPIRLLGGQKKPEEIMKFLLLKRHLAPTHTSTLYLPDENQDFLVIKEIPDIFASGHIHRVSVDNYKNVTLLNCSSWLKMSDYQKKVGLFPQPSRAIVVNLQTRNVKIMNFATGDVQDG